MNLLILAVSVTLAWDANPEPVDGYRIYVGIDHITNSAPAQVIGVGNVTQYEVGGLEFGTTYYFNATAYVQADGQILESGYSNEVVHAPVLPPPTPPLPSPDGTKALTVVDSESRVWTLNAERQTLRDGVWMAKGLGRMYKIVSGSVYVHGVNGTWWIWDGLKWENIGDEPEFPVPGTEESSPEGTKGVLIVDEGEVWTLNAERQTLRNGEWMDRGLGRIYKYVGGEVYAHGVNGTWWKWVGLEWVNIGPEP